MKIRRGDYLRIVKILRVDAIYDACRRRELISIAVNLENNGKVAEFSMRVQMVGPGDELGVVQVAGVVIGEDGSELSAIGYYGRKKKDDGEGDEFRGRLLLDDANVYISFARHGLLLSHVRDARSTVRKL